ncbi:MAG: hypothetical protein R3261_12825, partial [Alphaproteobacteria bacterium]|nr:hypothetical protein [Alphaproteobacteria bacterium]
MAWFKSGNNKDKPNTAPDAISDATLDTNRTPDNKSLHSDHKSENGDQPSRPATLKLETHDTTSSDAARRALKISLDLEAPPPPPPPPRPPKPSLTKPAPTDDKSEQLVAEDNIQDIKAILNRINETRENLEFESSAP